MNWEEKHHQQYWDIDGQNKIIRLSMTIGQQMISFQSSALF